MSLYKDFLEQNSVPHKPTVTGRSLAHAHRSASQRAAIAAQLVLAEVERTKPTIIQAAADTGANIPYVQFALKLKPGTRALVAAGEISLSEAAKVNGLLEAWLAATPAEKVALGAVVGIEEIWNSTLQPST